MYTINLITLLQIDWAAQMRADWDFSEDAAHEAMEIFLQDGQYSSKALQFISVKTLTLCSVYIISDITHYK